MIKRSLLAAALVLVVLVSVPVTAGATTWQEQAEATEKIDVNNADEEQLQRVPGIGPAMARRIIEWRNEHGRFERLDDLLDIRGIGTKTLEKLRPYLTLGDEEVEGD